MQEIIKQLETQPLYIRFKKEVIRLFKPFTSKDELSPASNYIYVDLREGREVLWASDRFNVKETNFKHIEGKDFFMIKELVLKELPDYPVLAIQPFENETVQVFEFAGKNGERTMPIIESVKPKGDPILTNSFALDREILEVCSRFNHPFFKLNFLEGEKLANFEFTGEHVDLKFSVDCEAASIDCEIGIDIKRIYPIFKQVKYSKVEFKFFDRSKPIAIQKENQRYLHMPVILSE